MLEPFGMLAQTQQCRAQEAMPDHNKRCCLLLPGEFEELARKRACCLALEVDELRDEEAVEDRVQQKWIFDMFAQCLRLLDHRAGLVERCFCFDRRKTLRVIHSVSKSDLKLDMFATPRGRCRQRRNLVEGARELGDCLDQRRALQ